MSLLSRLRADPLMRHNAVFFIGSLVVAVLNYAYHPIMSRLLRVDEFGEVMAIFSLSAQVGVLLGVFNMVAIHLSSNEKGDGGRNVLEDIYAIVFWVQVAVLVLLIILSPILETQLQFSSNLPFYLLALNMYVALPYGLLSASMQGKKQFVKLSLGSLMQAGGKLAFAAILVLLGAGVLGAIGGLVIAQLVTIYYFAGKSLREVRFFPRVRPIFDKALIAEFRYAVLVFITTSTIALLYTSDTVFVKYFFPPDMAGEYAGVSVIARILFFATASISAVLLPSITLAQSKQENYRSVSKSFLLLLLIGGVGLLLMLKFPELIITSLLGAKYLPFVHLLPQVALVMFLASFINLFFIFLLALRRYVLIPIALCGIVLLTVPISVAHDSLESIVRHFLITNMTILVALLGYLTYDYFRTTKQKTPVDYHPAL